MDDQKDILAQVTALKGDASKLTAGATVPTDLVSAGNAIFQLTAQKTEAEGKLTSANETITKVTGERDTANGQVTTITKDRDALTIENDKLKADMTDFNKKVATELAKHGIKTDATKPVQNDSGKKLTATEQLLAAKGVSSLDELVAKNRKN